MIEKIRDLGFGVISVEKELTSEEFLSKLYEANNKMQTNSLEGFEKLRQENKQLKEQLDVYKEALKLDSQGYVELINRLEKDFPDIFQFDEELKDVENYSLSCLEQAKKKLQK